MNERRMFSDTKKLTVAGLMAAITIIMVYTPIGMIPLPGISLTISHIPAIITALLFGPVMGCVLGFVFGVASLVRAITAPMGILDPLFINPIISVLPRVLIGLGAYYGYRLFAKLNENVGLAVGAAAGSMTNTVGVMLLIYVIYARDVVEKLASVGMETTAEAFVWLVITSSGVTEMLAAIIISFLLVKALKKALAL